MPLSDSVEKVVEAYVVKVKLLSQSDPIVVDWVRVPLSALALKVLDWAGLVLGLVIVMTGRVAVVKLTSPP